VCRRSGGICGIENHQLVGDGRGHITHNVHVVPEMFVDALEVSVVDVVVGVVIVGIVVPFSVFCEASHLDGAHHDGRGA
jgi:hypothetical protein